jgi:hypothetical protein
MTHHHPDGRRIGAEKGTALNHNASVLIGSTDVLHAAIRMDYESIGARQTGHEFLTNDHRQRKRYCAVGALFGGWRGRQHFSVRRHRSACDEENQPDVPDHEGHLKDEQE